MARPLNEYSVTRKVATKLLRRAALTLFEGAVEVRHVVEAALIGYLRHIVRGIDKHTRGVAQPNLGKAVDEGVTNPLLNKAAK